MATILCTDGAMVEVSAAQMPYIVDIANMIEDVGHHGATAIPLAVDESVLRACLRFVDAYAERYPANVVPVPTVSSTVRATDTYPGPDVNTLEQWVLDVFDPVAPETLLALLDFADRTGCIVALDYCACYFAFKLERAAPEDLAALFGCEKHSLHPQEQLEIERSS